MLASASPRRLALLRQIGLEPEVRPVDADETPHAGEAPEALVARLAGAKARSALETLAGEGPAGAGLVVVGADTVVVHAGRALGKPADRADFLAGLRALSGRWHRVVTGVAVLGRDAAGAPLAPRCVEVVTRVRFAEVDDAAALAYWASGEPADKAGGYALQGLGARFVERIEGSPSNVVGLPLHELALLLDAAGVRASYPRGPDGRETAGSAPNPPP